MNASLYVRLRNALGLGVIGLGSLGSGPCGSCFDTEQVSCVSLEEYRRWAAMNPGQAGAAGAGPGVAGAGPGDGACPPVEDFARFEDARLGYESAFDWLEGVPVADAGTAAAADGGAQCCYRGMSKRPRCAGGRPFLVHGEAELPCIEELARTAGARRSRLADRALERRLASAWLHAARVEHASVAAFARLSLELLAHGAPLALVAAAQRAGLDEIQHAELCLAEAHRYTEQRYRLGRLSVEGCLHGAADLASFVTTNILEGCIGETIAAAVTSEQARLTEDRALADALRRVAEDETEHAILAWRILSWALEADGGELAAVVHRVFSAARPRQEAEGSAAEHDPHLAAYGQLDAAAQATVAAGVWENAILPLAQELLGRFTSTGRAGRLAYRDQLA